MDEIHSVISSLPLQKHRIRLNAGLYASCFTRTYGPGVAGGIALRYS